LTFLGGKIDMSDLDTNGTRSTIGGAGSPVAISKLRSFRGTSATLGAADGLVDAFADVFARMAIAAPVESPRPPTSVDRPAEPSTPSDSTSTQETADDESVGQQAAPTPVEARSAVPLPVVAPEQALSAEVAVEPQSDSNEPALEILPVDDQQPQADPTVVTAPAPTPIVSDESIEVDQTLGQPVVAHSFDGDADAKAKAAEATPLTIQATPETGPAASAPIGNSNDVDAANATPTTESVADSGQQADGDSSRRDRRRGRGSDQSAVAQAAGTSPNAAKAQQRSDAAAPASSGFSVPTDSGSQPTTPPKGTPELQPKVDAAIHAAAAAAKVQSSAATSSVQASQRAEGLGQVRGAPSTSMSIDPAAGSRAETAARVDGPKKSDSSSDAQADLLARIKLVQRVSKAFQHLGAEGGVIRLRLAPAEMGTVRVEVRMQQKKVEARVVADTEAAGAALREHLPDLRARLESFGMQVEKIDVDVEPFHLGDDRGQQGDHRGAGHSNAFGDPSSQQQRSDRSTRTTTSQRGRVAPSVETVAASSWPTWTTASGGVDVRI
jgi:flagellar hook-length control protein FliK